MQADDLITYLFYFPAQTTLTNCDHHHICISTAKHGVQNVRYFIIWTSQHIRRFSTVTVIIISSEWIENRILRQMFGPKRAENGEWWRLHNEELHSLYRSPNLVRVIKSRRLRWAGHVARIEEGRSIFKILTSKPTGKMGGNRYQYEELGWFGSG